MNIDTRTIGNSLPSMAKFAIWAAALTLIAVLVSASWPLRSVPPGFMGVVSVFGKVEGAPLPSGLHIVNPLADVIPMDVRQYPMTIEGEVGTKDLQSVHGVLVVNYAAVPAQVGNLYQRFGMEWHKVIIAPAAADRMKAVTPHFTAEEMVTKRELVRSQMRAAVIEAVKERGEGMVLVTDVVVKDLGFAPAFKTAIEQKQVAEQNALKAERDLQRIKVEADQARAAAQGVADALVMNAKAEAEAFKLKAREITETTLRLSAVEKWDGKLPAYYGSSGPLPFISVR